jgi:hypothetical protein
VKRKTAAQYMAAAIAAVYMVTAVELGAASRWRSWFIWSINSRLFMVWAPLVDIGVVFCVAVRGNLGGVAGFVSGGVNLPKNQFGGVSCAALHYGGKTCAVFAGAGGKCRAVGFDL